ncbi:MAG: ATP-binding cassette domain-containing protein [Acidobacteriota bacterium]|nr:MAG: ATP-binding cassette domain-containing protein [Acidobacteriota bacterium]
MEEIRRLFPFVRPFLPLVVVAVLLLVVSGFLEALIIMLLAPIFNQLAPSAAAASGGDKFAFLEEVLGLRSDVYFLRVAVFLVVFSFFKGICLYFADYAMNYSGQRLVARIRQEVYQHILNQSLTFFSVYPTGKLMSRAIADTEQLQETVGKRLTDFIRQIFLLIFFLGLVFYADWKLAMLSFGIAPLVLIITTRMGRRIRRDSLASQESLSEISHALQQTITGQKIVKAFVAEGYEKKRFSRLISRLVRTNLKIAKVGALSSPLIEFIGYVAFVPFLLYFNYQINQGFTLGAFVVFIAALFRLYEPIRKLSRMHLHFQQSFASAQRIFEVLDAPVDIGDAPGATALAPLSRDVVFENVSFSYPGDEDIPVLRNINLRVRRGEIVALVGSSGAGKTTAVNLLPRFYDLCEGRILIDGRDIRDVTLNSLRSQIALVTQDTFLFDDSVRNNIAYGRSDVSLEKVQEAAKAAFIHDFIETLPEGYETRIGERGQRLSGGQRQRIAIARAVLKRSPILILDEATSALDSESEHLVQQALHNLMQHCTTLVIAHRLSTVRLANRIVVLDRGGIVEEGNHDKLIEASGIYRRLYELQFADVAV